MRFHFSETMEIIPILVGLGTPFCGFSPLGTVGIIAAINAAKKPLIPYYDDGAVAADFREP